MRRYTILAFTACLLLLLLFGFISCEKFEGDQTIPAFLSIDSIYMQTDYLSQGSASQNITDAWVYVDGNLVGAFQMPARFPVLKQGKHTVAFYPGVKKDGIAATRITYPFYKPIEQQINFVPDSTVKAGILKSGYLSTTKFLWKEDFEDVAISLDSTKTSTVAMELTPEGSDLTFEGLHSGVIRMDTANNFAEFINHDQYSIPSAPVFLEMNFNTNNKLSIGVIIYTDVYVSYQVPVLTLFPTNNSWKKIYIDLTTTLNSYSGGVKFRIFLGGFLDNDVAHAQIMIDNLKLVSR